MSPRTLRQGRVAELTRRAVAELEDLTSTGLGWLTLLMWAFVGALVVSAVVIAVPWVVTGTTW